MFVCYWFVLKYGFCNKSFRKDEPLTIFVIKIRFSSNQNIGEGESNFDDEYVEESVQWSEVHLSEMTFYKIHTLIAYCSNVV